MYCKLLKNSFLVLFALLQGTAFGQFFIKETQWVKHDYSIVRQAGYDSFLVYTPYEDANFVLYVDGNSTASVLVLPQLPNFDNYRVNDFEILNDTVFFCGSRKNSQAVCQSAVFGYFPLSNFPYGNVYLAENVKQKEYRKIDVFETAGKAHTVMVGSVSFGTKDVIVDGVQSTPNHWNFQSVEFDGLGVDLNDIAVTDSFIVATGFGGANNQGWLHYLTKPTSYMNVNYLTLRSFNIGYAPDSIMLIEHCYGDHFATITKDDNNRIYVNRYNGIGFEDALRYSGDARYVYRDFKYNIFTDKLDVLLRHVNGTTRESLICNVGYSGPSYNIGYAMYYYAYDAYLYSLDYLTTRPQWDIVSGEISGTLALVRHRNGMWQCNTHSFFGWRKKTYYPDEKDLGDLGGKGYVMNASAIECGKGSVMVVDNCIEIR